MNMFVRINASVARWRPLTSAEAYQIEVNRATWFRLYESFVAKGRDPGFRPNLRRQFYAQLLEVPNPGDNLTIENVPEGVEEVWVRWLRDGALWCMRVWPHVADASKVL